MFVQTKKLVAYALVGTRSNPTSAIAYQQLVDRLHLVKTYPDEFSRRKSWNTGGAFISNATRQIPASVHAPATKPTHTAMGNRSKERLA